MIREVEQEFTLLQAVHVSIDKMLDGLTEAEWMKKAGPEFNSLASVIDHVLLVEEKFLSALSGSVKDINTQAPFQTGPAPLQEIQKRWQDSLETARNILSGLQQDDLEAPGLKLGIGELNQRQLISYMIAHTAHHRGQIPIIKKLNKNV